VFAGMLGVTLFGIFLTPVFFYVIQWLNDRRARRRALEPDEEEPDEPGPSRVPSADGEAVGTTITAEPRH
jgi:hypothetical protein